MLRQTGLAQSDGASSCNNARTDNWQLDFISLQQQITTTLQVQRAVGAKNNLGRPVDGQFAAIEQGHSAKKRDFSSRIDGQITIDGDRIFEADIDGLGYGQALQIFGSPGRKIRIGTRANCHIKSDITSCSFQS